MTAIRVSTKFGTQRTGLSSLVKIITGKSRQPDSGNVIQETKKIPEPAIRFKNKLLSTKFKPSKISIIILAWNQWQFTEQCIKSIMGFSYDYDFEIVVVDNGSTDETGERLKTFKTLYPTMKVVSSLDNLGPAGGRDLGTLYTEGEYLIYLDNDTIVRDQNWISNIISTLNTHHSIGSTGTFSVIHTSDEIEDFIQAIFIPDLPIPVDWASGFCVAYKRQAIIDVGGWRPDLYHLWGSEDAAMGYALRDKGWLTISSMGFIYVDHLIQHRNKKIYDYDCAETARKNSEIFRKIWGKRYRLIDPVRSNKMYRDEKLI